MREAVCKNKIASMRLMKQSELTNTEIVCIKGKKRHWWSFPCKETIVKRNRRYMTFPELVTMLGPIHLYIDGDKIRIKPQVIVHYQVAPWSGKCNAYAFGSDAEATEYFENLIKENGMEEIEVK